MVVEASWPRSDLFEQPTSDSAPAIVAVIRMAIGLFTRVRAGRISGRPWLVRQAALRRDQEYACAKSSRFPHRPGRCRAVRPLQGLEASIPGLRFWRVPEGKCSALQG